MAKATRKLQNYVHYHRNGSIWACGQKTADGVLTGYWEWFRKDGTKMRSGYFADGEQVGEWTTFDRKGKVVKVTQMKGKTAVKKTMTKKSATKKVAKKKSPSKKSAKQ
jgi:antitoxin component YwqK of YwqJK toxin-antitoxin module